MFDIDGTLTESMNVDEECFIRTFTDVFEFTDIDTDWLRYKHVTDSGLLQEIFHTRNGRPISARETLKFQQRFFTLLGNASPFRAVKGAVELLRCLSTRHVYRVSLATGGWRVSAHLKMASAGMCFDDFPAASADDAVAREDIMRASMQRASTAHGGHRFASTVYVGDGVWDARVCRGLRIPFIGIGTGVHAEKLRAEGAARVFADLSDGDSLLTTLDQIAVETQRL